MRSRQQPTAPFILRNLLVSARSTGVLRTVSVHVTECMCHERVLEDYCTTQHLEDPLSEIWQQPCQCSHLMTHPLLHNTLHHVVIVHPWQWQLLFPPPVSTILASNSKNRLWHFDEYLSNDFSACAALLDKCILPIYTGSELTGDASPCATVPSAPLFGDLLRTVHVYNPHASASCPHLCYSVVQDARDALLGYVIVCGVFDKCLTKHWGAPL